MVEAHETWELRYRMTVDKIIHVRVVVRFGGVVLRVRLSPIVFRESRGAKWLVDGLGDHQRLLRQRH